MHSMQRGLEACRGLFKRFDEGDGYISIRNAGILILGLERSLLERELNAMILKLGRRADGAINFVGLCEVVSYVMKGTPHTNDTLRLVDFNGCETIVTLADVATAGLKSLYLMHPTFDQQHCWLHTESALAAYCVTEGDAIASAITDQVCSFLIRARDWLQRSCMKGGERFEVRILGPHSLRGEVVDNGDGTYVASYACSIPGAYSIHVTLNGAHISRSPFALVVDVDQTTPEYCVAEGVGLTRAEAGKLASFTIYKRDHRGNPRTRGIDHFYADVQGPVSQGIVVKCACL